GTRVSILLLDPGGHLGSVSVFQPTVGITDANAEMCLHDVLTPGHGLRALGFRRGGCSGGARNCSGRRRAGAGDAGGAAEPAPLEEPDYCQHSEQPRWSVAHHCQCTLWAMQSRSAVFVYGSLKRGFRHARMLDQALWLG